MRPFRIPSYTPPCITPVAATELPPDIAGSGAIPVQMGAQVFEIRDWYKKSDPNRIKLLRQVAETGAQNPRVAELAVRIFRSRGVQPREYERQAAALLDWIQKNVYYVNETGEKLQSVEYTLEKRQGDCDDLAITLAAMAESVRLPWRFVLSGNTKSGQLVRWIEGTPIKAARWTHIYLVIGWPPYQPKTWKYAEPTLRGVKLGWDVVQHRKRYGSAPLPELAGPAFGDAATTAVIVPAPPELAKTIRAEVEAARAAADAEFDFDLTQELRRAFHWKRLLLMTATGAVSGILGGLVATGIRSLWSAPRKS